MNYDKYMQVAFVQAKISLQEGNKGFGALIVKDEKILAQSYDTEVTENDPTAHAEMNCIKKAVKSGQDIEDSIIISTHEPCPMCMTAIIWSNFSELVYSVSIEESLKQGRKRINISSKELKKRSKSQIKIKEGVLKEKCILLYNSKVREYIQLFKNLDLNDYEIYRKALFQKRKDWFNKNKGSIDKLSGSDVEKAYQLLIKKFDIAEDQMPIVEKSKNKIVFHSQNQCPTLEACKILDIDTKLVCKEIFEEPTRQFIKMINPQLDFIRNYDKIRPYKEYCEEIIILKD